MDTLDQTDWDIVICGTGLPQSLLALALSRSGKRILHIDRNDFYGDDEAALSLAEAERWASAHASRQDTPCNTVYYSASITKPTSDIASDKAKLALPRAYSVALAPQLVFARSSLPPAVVSSRIHSQLEFQAVGSWFTVDSTSSSGPKLVRVPNGREDVFQDTTLDLKAKRSLMKFIRFVTNYEEQEDWDAVRHLPFVTLLKDKFGLPEGFHQALLALTLLQQSGPDIITGTAVSNIARHLRSIGIFGPGFSAVLPKWGGLAEISQVACRGCAVGGGVYVLNKGLTKVNESEDGALSLELSDGEKVTSRWLVGSSGGLPADSTSSTETANQSMSTCIRSISIVSSPLTSLFPRTSEGGVIPAGAVVQVQSGRESMPVYIMVHSSEAGECPSDQCVLYASVAASGAFDSLERAVHDFLQSLDEESPPEVLWSMQYIQQVSDHHGSPDSASSKTVTLKTLSTNIALEDDVLDDVKRAWVRITGEEPEDFMRFEARDGTGEDD